MKLFHSWRALTPALMFWWLIPYLCVDLFRLDESKEFLFLYSYPAIVLIIYIVFVVYTNIDELFHLHILAFLIAVWLVYFIMAAVLLFVTIVAYEISFGKSQRDDIFLVGFGVTMILYTYGLLSILGSVFVAHLIAIWPIRLLRRFTNPAAAGGSGKIEGKAEEPKSEE